MIYELRIGEVMPGKLRVLVDRMGNQVVDLFKKHGIGMVGFWTDDVGTTNRLTYILSFEDMGDRERKFDALRGDPDWERVLKEERERDGLVVDRAHNRLLRLTPYSPEPKVSSNVNVNELRTYEAMPGKLPILHERFANYTDGLFKKHGMEVVAYWTEEVGTSDQLVYMLGYPGLGHREESFASLATDPVWLKALQESEMDGPLLKRVHSRMLRPTAYSPRR